MTNDLYRVQVQLQILGNLQPHLQIRNMRLDSPRIVLDDVSPKIEVEGRDGEGRNCPDEFLGDGEESTVT